MSPSPIRDEYQGREPVFRNTRNGDSLCPHAVTQVTASLVQGPIDGPGVSEVT